MANQEQLDILKQGVKTWNEWRDKNPTEAINLYGAELSGADLSGAILSNADMTAANLNNANLIAANMDATNLVAASLIGANMSGVSLSRAVLYKANLTDTNLTSAHLSNTYLYGADLSGVNLRAATFHGGNMFGDVDLSTVKGLETVSHYGPSAIGTDTIYRSQGKIPEAFLKEAGVPDSFIEYMHSLVGNPIDYYSCFISYSSKDEAFAKRLYADLQSNHVRCWFAPEDLKIGDKIRPRIDESIRIYDKLLLVLSEYSVASTWVEFEVEAAMDKEKEGKSTVLFPVRLDNIVMESTAAWAAHIKRTRNIGDFTRWKNHDDYEKAFRRLLRDLKAGA